MTVSDTSLHMLFPSTVRLWWEARTPGSCIMRGNTSLLRTEEYFLFTETRGWGQEGLADEWRRNRRGGLNSLWTVHLPVLREETVWFTWNLLICRWIKDKVLWSCSWVNVVSYIPPLLVQIQDLVSHWGEKPSEATGSDPTYTPVYWLLLTLLFIRTLKVSDHKKINKVKK